MSATPSTKPGADHIGAGMSAEAARDAILVALRRDLLGPLTDPDGTYPGATAVPVTSGHRFTRPSESRQLLVAPDGHEVLLAEPPTSRYIVGALYPALRAAEERELDNAQAPALPEPDEVSAEDAADMAPKPPQAPSAPDALTDSEAVEDSPDDSTGTTSYDRPGRPSSFGFSFVLKHQAGTVVPVRLDVAGGRYEPFPVQVVTTPRTGWHHRPVHADATFDLPPDGAEVNEVRDLVCGTLNVQVGIHARTVISGQRIVTCYLVNRTTASTPLSQRVLFAARLAATLPPQTLAEYPDRDADTSPEAASLRLLYAAAPVRAVGHGTDAVSLSIADRDVVATESLPVARVAGTTADISDGQGPLRVNMDALGRWDDEAVATVDRMLASYRQWIIDRTQQADTLPGEARATAEQHLAICRQFADDMEAGWLLARTDCDVGQCLRWTSQVMASQRRSYAAKSRSVRVDERSGRVSVEGLAPAVEARLAWWRPFQLAFVLANLAPVTDVMHRRRGVVDVIWMPTGGGKTEAYLALAGFTMLHRRLAHPDTCGGTAVLMRYTLRLLTAQQLQRAASLICALEQLRVANRDRLGKDRFAIGAWLGRASTPNWRKDAITELRNLANGRRGAGRPFLLSRCPSCAAEMGRVVSKTVLGYGVQPTPSGDRMQASCPNPDCAFHLSNTQAGLPVYEVDEDLYTKAPTFVVATVDKFAQLAWNERSRTLFGLDTDGARRQRSPDLVIQDELHLISGPLGSLVGLYESAIATVCTHDGGQRPHVVAATATTRAYARQAASLYACPTEMVRLVPPPGLDVDDSFFAQRDETTPSKAFVAVCATGVGRFAHAQMRVLASLAHAAAALDSAGASVDPYWTNVAFFGSLRDLGQAKALVATDLRGYAWRLVRATGVRTGAPRPDGTRRAIRTVRDVELTSSSSADATEALERLGRRRGEAKCVDLALATSVIEVGVDVDRLGLLTIVRQPKTSAQYIQVAGRVGRNPATGPGLVVTVLNPLAARDVSHYERFSAVHERLYAAVEPASVTPFTDAALTRGLRGTLAAIIRQTRTAHVPAVLDTDRDRAQSAVDAVSARADQMAGSTIASRVKALAGAALTELTTAVGQGLEWGNAGRSSGQFLRPLENPPPEDAASWAVLTSLRSVDADAALRIDEDWLPARTVVRRPVDAADDDGATPPPADRAPAGPEEEAW